MIIQNMLSKSGPDPEYDSRVTGLSGNLDSLIVR